MSGATQLGGLTITFNRLYIINIIFAAMVVAALMAALRYNVKLGLRMRAVTAKPAHGKLAMGISHAVDRCADIWAWLRA